MGTASVSNRAIQPPEREHHIYLSEHHPRLLEMAHLLEEKWPNLKVLVSGDAGAAAHTCDWAVVTLSNECFVGRRRGALL